MLKKIALCVVAIVLLAAVANLVAQQAGRGPRGDMGPGQRGMMRGGFGTWFDDLAKAYEQNDKEKMGELIEEMKQRRQGMGRPMDRPGGPGGPDFGPGRGGRPGGDSATTATSLAGTEAEKKILDVLDDMDKNQRRGMMNVPVEDGRLIRLLARAIGAKTAVEIGTSNGYSGIWTCLALRDTGGKLITHEIDARRAALARENFKRAGVDSLVTLVEGDAHEEVKKLKGQIDLVFIDADKSGYKDYLDKLLPLVRPGGLILAHNTANAGSEMEDYIKAITTDANLETMSMGSGRGMGVTLKKR